jgi:hypothetical protein
MKKITAGQGPSPGGVKVKARASPSGVGMATSVRDMLLASFS